MDRVLTLSGWGQPTDALHAVAPSATHVDYAQYADVDAALAMIANTGRGYDTVIGWSLGGQLAVRAIAAGMLRPKHLILLATPFRFVASEDDTMGMGRETFAKFRDNYRRNPERTLTKSWELIAYEDSKGTAVREHLQSQDKSSVMSKHWLYWLDELERFSADTLSYKDFPPTLLVHGKKDAVVVHAQSLRFAELLPQARLISYEEAGHAPHWHDSQGVMETIAECAYV